jgi:hypothetical protein
MKYYRKNIWKQNLMTQGRLHQPVKVNCRLKCFVTLVTYCYYNNVFEYFNLYLNLTHVGATGP